MTDVGIVGLASFYGPDYAERIDRHSSMNVAGGLARRGDEELRRLGRPARSAFAERHDCPMFDELEELIDAVDALVIASRTTRRAADAFAALERGRPVLTAKPASATIEGARSVAEAASDEVPAVTTSPARFDDAIGELGRRVHRGDLGRVVAIRGSIRHDRVPRAGIDVNAEHAPDQAGATFAMGFYTADMLIWLNESPPARVSGWLGNVNSSHCEHPDLGSAVVEFENFTQGSMSLTYSTDCREPLGNWELEVVGTDGIARTGQIGYEGIHWSVGEPEEREAESFARTSSPVLDRQLDAFLTTVKSGRYGDLVPDPHTVVESISLCAAWERAANRGSWEEVEVK